LHRVLTAPFQWLFFKETIAGAQTQIRLAVDPELNDTTGKYFSDCKESWTMWTACLFKIILIQADDFNKTVLDFSKTLFLFLIKTNTKANNLFQFHSSMLFRFVMKTCNY
jgi:hypothetical protein